MVGKNNLEVKHEKSTDKVHKFSIRKFKNGIASAAIGALLVGAGSTNIETVSAEALDGDGSEAGVTQVDEDEVTTDTQTEKWDIEFETEYVEVDDLLVGEEREVQAGQNGLREDLIEVTYRGNVPIGREVINSTVLEEAVTRIVEIGTIVEEKHTQTTTDIIEFETEYVEVDDLAPGEEREVQAGQNGLREDLVEWTYHNNVPVNTEVIETRVLEEPVTRIVEVGAALEEKHTQTENHVIEFETEYVEVDDLLVGEEREVQAGQNGLREDVVEWTYRDGVPVNQEVLDSSVLEEAVNRIVEVGTIVEEKHTQTETHFIDFETEYVEVDDLLLGEEREVQAGQNGLREDVVEWTYHDGVPVNQEVLESRVLEEAVNRIVEVGTIVEEKSTQTETWHIDFETEYVEVDDLLVGEERVVQAGRKGLRADVVEWTYHNGVPVDREVLESRVLEEAVNRIVEVGTVVEEKYTQTETWDIDFETEYVEVDDLLVGEERVVQEGQTGLREDVVEVTYHDGVPVDREVLESTVLEEAVNRIVEIGTIVEEKYTQTETWDIDFETEYVEVDDLLVGEERVVQEGQTGLREDVVEVTYHDGVPVDREVLESRVLEEAVNRIVEVGTLVQEVSDVIEGIDGLTFDEWNRGFSTNVAEVREAFNALDEDLQALVTNYGALEVAEARVAINTVIREVRRADLEEEDYTEESWGQLAQAYRWAEVSRDNPRATVESITKDLNDLRYAFDNLVEREVVESYPLGVEVRGLDGTRTDDVRIWVTNEDGESVAGSFDQYGRWASDEELPVGRYRINIRTPKGTYAILNDTVQQGTEDARGFNSFVIDINADNLFANSRVYAGIQLRLVREVRNVIEGIDGLAFDEWDRSFPENVTEVREAFNALDEDLQALVTNYGALEVAETRVAINDLIREVRRADLEEEDYTEESWAELVEAYRAAEIVRDAPNATVESITKDLNDLRYAFDHLVEREVIESYPFGIEVRGLDGRRTDDIRIEVTNEDGETIVGSFDQYGRWASDEELPVGRYSISIRTPKGTYAILNDSVQQGTEDARGYNNFVIDINADNLFGNSRVYAGIQLRLVREVRDVIEGIDGLTFDEWYRGFPTNVEEVREAYNALDEDLQELVTNYGALEVAEARVAINTLIREVRRADLDEEDYTEESWSELVDALEWAVISRDNPSATVESITKDLNDLQYAFDNLMTKKQAAWNDLLDRVEDLENQLDELKEENADLKAELDQLRAELAALRADQEAAEDRIKELEDRIAELEDRVDELEARPTPETPTDEDEVDEDEVDEDEVDEDEVDEDEVDEDEVDEDEVDEDEVDEDEVDEDEVDKDEVDEDEDDQEEDELVELPETGAAASGIGLGIASLLSGLGLSFVGKKRKEDE